MASKIILIFLCALVPVNVLLIYSTQSYMAALRFQMINSGRNVMELAMLRLDNQMDTMELYLYTQSTEDSDFIRVSMDEGDDFFLVSLHSVYRDFSNNLAVNSISGFYYLMAEESQQTVVAFSNDQSENRETVQTFLAQREESLGPSVWELVEIGERQYLFRECVEESVRYGSAIDVSGFLEQINANVRFDDSAVALLGWDELPQGFDLRQMTLEQNGTLYVYARSDNAPVVVELQVDQDTIYYSLPIVNRVAFVFSFACLLLVPFLYILFHRMILRPLGVLDRAFRAHLNPDYLNRVFKKAKGISINKFIINQRMSLAMELMKGGLSATAAAQEVGYQNYANFVNMFKKVYGKLPSQLGEK